MVPVFVLNSTQKNKLMNVWFTTTDLHCAGFIHHFEKANLEFYQGGKYKPIKVNEPVTIVVCTDNVSIRRKEPFVHSHRAVSNKKGEVMGVYVM